MAATTVFGAGVIDQIPQRVEVGYLGDADAASKKKVDEKDTSFEPDWDYLNAMTDEERVERVRESVERHPRHRELLYSLLAYVGENPSCSHEEAEDYLCGLPQYKSSLQEAGILVSIMERAGGIVDSGDALTVTEPGATFAAGYTPEVRMAALIEGSDDDQIEAYRLILSECLDTKQTYEYLNGLLEYTGPTRVKKNGQMAIYPSTYIDRLEKAGGLLWDAGWTTTEAGSAYAG